MNKYRFILSLVITLYSCLLYGQNDCDTIIDGKTIYPLGVACWKGELENVKKILASNDSIAMSDEIYEYDIFYAAVYWEQSEILQYLLQYNNKKINEIYNDAGLTLLGLSCMLSNISISNILIEHGANVDGYQTPSIEYKDDGTSMESKDAINWINDWTSLKATKLKEYNANEIFMAANFFSNKLVYMRGNRGKNDFLGITIKYTGGHAWVADGAFSARRKSDNKFVNLYHFNWGWDGSNNGYFLATVFDSSNPAIKDSELPGYLSLDDDGTPGNYKYNVEYSVIENPNISGGGTIQ